MWSFTGRELEFLASLRHNWARLYRNELLRLLKEDAGRFGRADAAAARSAVADIVA